MDCLKMVEEVENRPAETCLNILYDRHGELFSVILSIPECWYVSDKLNKCYQQLSKSSHTADVVVAG